MSWTDHPLVRELDSTAEDRFGLMSAPTKSSLDQHSLVPGLPALLGQMKFEHGTPVLIRNLPAQLNKCSRTLEQLHVFHVDTIQKNSDRVAHTNALYLVEPQTRELFSIAVESFLNYVVQVQNHWIGLLSLAIPSKGKSLPSSLNDVMKRIDLKNGPVSRLPDLVKENLKKYWNRHGRTARLYRDYAQHFGEVVSEIQIFKSTEGDFALVCQLLNNPEEKSSAKAKWGNPPIHCFLYVLQELEALISFSGWLVQLFVERPDDGKYKLMVDAFKTTSNGVVGPGVSHYGLVSANPAKIREIIDSAVKVHSPFNHET